MIELSATTRQRLLRLRCGAVTAFVLLTLTACGQRRQDRLPDNATNTHASTGRTLAERCGSKNAYELVKRELFRRAAQTRGDDDPTFEPVVAGSTLSLDRATAQSADNELGSVNCTATASLVLPSGMVAAGGRSSLAAEIGYVLQPAADQSGEVATLTNAERITVPLATIARSAALPSSPPAQPTAAQVHEEPRTATGVPSGPAPPANEEIDRPPTAASTQTAAGPVRHSSPAAPAQASRDGSRWRLVRTLNEGPLNTRIYLDQQARLESSGSAVRVRTRYVGTLEGQEPVQTFTDETIECDTGFHTQHSYVVQNASGRIVSRRGAQPRKKILPGTMLKGLLGTICS